MLVRYTPSWFLGALLYGMIKLLRRSGGDEQLDCVSVQCGHQRSADDFLSMAATDAKLLASFILGAVFCHVLLVCGSQMPSEGVGRAAAADARATLCPDKAQLFNMLF
eukprot:TRINITY_DN23227_c0_g1_i4.p1 TRINITY_DN23227_c0_g1~~TRINITY_DN23227_c0_g1_i4.p1  ORF type:complete len:108 (-),score=19.54 TRINITY_DN23227_c0_g1_i4:324-647(-)